MQADDRQPELLQHQREGIEWIRKTGRGLLGDEPGLGKTRQAIEAFDGGRVLVIAPAMVITGGTWSDELERWASHPERFTVLPYTALNERIKTKKGGYAPSSRLVADALGHFDGLIVDECHYIKGRNTYWTDSVKDIAGRSDAALLMTGTPIPNWAHELFTLLQAIHPEHAKRGGWLGSYWRWVGEWFEVSPSPFDATAKVIGRLKACRSACYSLPPTQPCEHYFEFMQANLQGRFLRRLREDCLDLPPVTTQVIQTPMTASQKKHYNEMKKDYMTTVNDTEVVSWSTGARSVALDRITTSPWLLSMEGDPKGGKFEQLRFDLEGRSRPTLVLGHYRETVNACRRVATSIGARAASVHGGVPRKLQAKAIADFKAGNLDVLCGSLETVAEGLQLTVADMAIFVETSYKPYRNEQARQRVHRLGQTRPVTIKEYVTPKTVDERKRQLLAIKTDEQLRMLSAGEFKKLL